MEEITSTESPSPGTTTRPSTRQRTTVAGPMAWAPDPEDALVVGGPGIEDGDGDQGQAACGWTTQSGTASSGKIIADQRASLKRQHYPTPAQIEKSHGAALGHDWAKEAEGDPSQRTRASSESQGPWK